MAALCTVEENKSGACHRRRRDREVETAPDRNSKRDRSNNLCSVYNKMEPAWNALVAKMISNLWRRNEV